MFLHVFVTPDPKSPIKIIVYSIGFDAAEGTGNLEIGRPILVAQNLNISISLLSNIQQKQLNALLNSLLDLNFNKQLKNLQSNLEKTFVHTETCVDSKSFDTLINKGKLLELLFQRKAAVFRKKRSIEAIFKLHDDLKVASDKLYIAEKILKELRKNSKANVQRIYDILRISYSNRLAKEGLINIWPLYVKSKFNIEMNEYPTNTRSGSRPTLAPINPSQTTISPLEEGDNIFKFGIEYINSIDGVQETKIYWAEKMVKLTENLSDRELIELFQKHSIPTGQVTEKNELILVLINYLNDNYNLQLLLPTTPAPATLTPVSPAQTPIRPSSGNRNWPQTPGITDSVNHRESTLIEEESENEGSGDAVYHEETFNHWTYRLGVCDGQTQIAVQGRESFYILKDKHLSELSREVTNFISEEVNNELSFLLDTQCKVSQECVEDEVMDRDQRYLKLDRNNPPETLTDLESRVLSVYNTKTQECEQRLERECRSVEGQDEERIKALEEGLRAVNIGMQKILTELNSDNIKERKEIKQDVLKEKLQQIDTLTDTFTKAQRLQTEQIRDVKAQKEVLTQLGETVQSTLQQIRTLENNLASNVVSTTDVEKTILQLQTRFSEINMRLSMLEAQSHAESKSNTGTDSTSTDTSLVQEIIKVKNNQEGLLQQVGTIANKAESLAVQLKAKKNQVNKLTDIITLVQNKLAVLEIGSLSPGVGVGTGLDITTISTFLDMYTETLFTDFQNELYDLIKYENQLQNNIKSNQLYNVIEGGCGIKNLRSINHIKGNNFAIFFDPQLYYELIPREIETPDYVVSLDTSAHYGYAKFLNSSLYCVDLVEENDYNYCPEWKTDHPCMYAMLSNGRDSCYFMTKYRRTSNQAKFQHFLCQNYCYFVTTTKKVLAEKITDDLVKKVVRYFMPYDTLLSELRHLKVDKGIDIFSQLAWTDQLAVISIIIGAINIVLLITVFVQKCIRKCLVYYRYSRSDREGQGEEMMALRRVRFRQN